MICSSLCRVPFIAVSSSWVAENSHSRWSSFRGLGQILVEMEVVQVFQFRFLHTRCCSEINIGEFQ